ncbi:hypothetical protein [Lentzea kentuckyensis]|uniref:hypothetical protein n=1 Tax=Lentzea kentuckyensis TaxID=360086 RepID=UPI001179A4D4|nr:hypothetical protein [Lentzea kentuckyensis]
MGIPWMIADGVTFAGQFWLIGNVESLRRQYDDRVESVVNQPWSRGLALSEGWWTARQSVPQRLICGNTPGNVNDRSSRHVDTCASPKAPVVESDEWDVDKIAEAFEQKHEPEDPAWVRWGVRT